MNFREAGLDAGGFSITFRIFLCIVYMFSLLVQTKAAFPPKLPGTICPRNFFFPRNYFPRPVGVSAFPSWPKVP